MSRTIGYNLRNPTITQIAGHDLVDELLGRPLSKAEKRTAPRADVARPWCTAGEPISFTILGEPVSKANSRQIVMVGPPQKRRPLVIKSEKARRYEQAAIPQVPLLLQLLQGPVRVTVHAWYATERPDLDVSIVLDVLQGRVLENDRQVRELHAYHAIDAMNPRAEVVIEPLQAQQAPLL